MNRHEESKKSGKKQKAAAPLIYVDEGANNEAIVAKRGSTFSLPRITSYCKHGKYAERIAAGTPIYLTCVLEYLCFEVLELAIAEAMKDGKKRVNPTHVMRACKNDPELNKLING